MGFFSKKKKQQSKDDSSTALAPSSSRLRSSSPDPSSQSTSSHGTQKPASTASRFNPFRSSSFPTSNTPSPSAHSAPPQAPSNRLSNFAPSGSSGYSRDLSANLHLDTGRSSRQGDGWEDLGAPLTGSPVALSSQHFHNQQESSPLTQSGRFRLFGSGGGSTVSLPLPPPVGRSSMEQETLREQQQQHSRAESAVYETEVEKRSRWKLGRGAAAKRRSGSVGSSLSMHQATGSSLGVSSQHGEEDNGFFVRSFRTVSRVQDPISSGPYESLRQSSSPPLPALPPPSPQQYPSRPSLDYEPRTSFSGSRPPQRPPLNTRTSPGSGSWTNAERAPSPTISVEAFRFASNRSRSTTSLGSALDEAPPERPRFEPSKSRRSSFMSETSDAGVGALAPPRPQYATQHSRSSSNSSEASLRDTRGQHQQGMAQFDSLASVASYSTAPERPNISREVSSEDELKFIAMYSTSPEVSSRPLPASGSSPYISSLPFESDSTDLDIEHLRSSSHVSKPTPPARSPRRNSSGPATPTTVRQDSFAPAVAVQPPTPVTQPGFVPPHQSPSASRERTASAMAASTGKSKSAAKGWNSDSSEAEGPDSDEDDDVPLAKIQSRSQTDLSLYSHQQSSSSNLLRPRKSSSEVEVLADTPSVPRPTTPTVPKSATQPTSRESLGRGTPPMSPSAFARSIPPLSPSATAAAALRRQGSQRRSVSTLSLSNTALPSASAGMSKLHTPTPSFSGPPHPTLGYRSLSNPSSPAPTASHTFLPSSSSTSLVPSLASSPVITPATSAASSQPRVVSSSSSGSGSGSGSSAPRTPKDLSPAVSDLGMKSSVSTARSSLLGGGSGEEDRRQVKFADHSSLVSLAGKTTNRMSAQALHTPPSRANIGPPKSSSMANLHQSSASLGGQPKMAGSVASFAQGHQPQKSSLSNSRSSASVSTGSVFDRMKARHKAETLSAIALGKDLNGPDDVIADEDDEEDDDEPLSTLPARRGSNSQLGSLYHSGGSMMGMPQMSMPMQGQHHYSPQQLYGHAPQSSFGGYSPLAMAPPGVDPYLYASLPPDQKQALHQRSAEMMRMMAQAAYQAKAESQGGWDTGSNLSGGGSAYTGGGGHQPRSSISGFSPQFGAAFPPPMGMPMMGYGAMHPPQPVPSSPSAQSSYGSGAYSAMPRGARLPPFAPSFALSQPMFQPSVYAGSAIGLPTGGSMMGLSTGGGRGAGGKRAPASALGTGRR